MAAEAASFVLDSSALLAYFTGESGAARVKELLKGKPSVRPKIFLSLASLAELAALIERQIGMHESAALLARVADLPIKVLPLDYSSVIRAAHFQAVFNLSFAAACAVVAAMDGECSLLTTDPAFGSLMGVIQVENVG